MAILGGEMLCLEVFEHQQPGRVEAQDLVHPALGLGVRDGQTGLIGGFFGAEPLAINGQADDAGVMAEGLMGQVEAGGDVGVAWLKLEDGFDPAGVVSGEGLLVVYWDWGCGAAAAEGAMWATNRRSKARDMVANLSFMLVVTNGDDDECAGQTRIRRLNRALACRSQGPGWSKGRHPLSARRRGQGNKWGALLPVPAL